MVEEMPRLSRDFPNDRWFPTPVEQLDDYLSRLIRDTSDVRNTYELRRNIAYSIQFLQYLDFSMQDLLLTAVITKQTIKSFIVVGLGIVETILYYLLRAKGLQKICEWRPLRVISTNEFKSDDSILKIENHLLQKIDRPEEEEMSFDAMLKKTESRKLLGNEVELYKQLNYLRKLRNKVHLHLVTSNLDTDWHAFDQADYGIIKKALLKLFISNLFNPTQEQQDYFQFLREHSQES
jgi:hypothetical protein